MTPEYDPNLPQPVAAPGYAQTVTPEQMAAIQQAAAQQGAAQQAAAMQTAAAAQPAAASIEAHSEPVRDQIREEIRLYGHSPLAYWWPVWVVGYVAAALSHFAGRSYALDPELHSTFYPDTNLGVAFILTLFFVIIVTNISVRGLASVVVVLGIFLTVVLLAYFRMWDQILTWFAGLNVFLNTGAYFWFSTLMFITWLVTVFGVDHMSYWTIKPGQITQSFILGSSSKSYDTQNMVVEKFRSDLFRHWVLGLGSGDLRIETQGAQHSVINLHNVFFIGSKIGEIQKLIATRPTEFGSPTFK